MSTLHETKTHEVELRLKKPSESLPNYDANNRSTNAAATSLEGSPLATIMEYTGVQPRVTRKQRIAGGHAPDAVVTWKGTYEFRRQPGAQTLEVRRVALQSPDATPWQPVPVSGATSVYACAHGLVFYNPTEIMSARVTSTTAHGAERATCRFGAKCTKATCKYAHPVPCRFGVKCRSLGAGSGGGGGGGGSGGGGAAGAAGAPAPCKFLHPDPQSVVPLGAAHPLNIECKYGPGCTSKKCHYAHSRGRGAKPTRTERQVLATHDFDLSPLPVPVALDLGDRPASATHVQFQGEFVFFFTPYSGPYAREHFRTVSIHRNANAATDEHSGPGALYARIGDYELDGHYCNAAVGCGRYFSLSWWPFEEEAMRAVWEAQRERRAQVKFAEALAKENERLRRVASSQQKKIRGRDAKLKQQRQQVKQLRGEVRSANQAARTQAAAAQAAKRQAADAKRRAAQAKAQAKAKAQQRSRAQFTAQVNITINIRQMERERIRAQSRRSERFRFLDPIHIYALQGGASGQAAEDWRLVVDYHKGAHALRITGVGSSGSGSPERQQLHITEHDKVFSFDLVAPHDLSGVRTCVPGLLCPGF